MDFQLSEEQQMLKDVARKISVNEFAPVATEIDEQEQFPWRNKKILEENGLLGIQILPQYGSAGSGMVSLAIVIEETARVCASTSIILTTQALATEPLVLAGSEAQKLKWLKPMAEGAILGSCAITEPGAGNAANDWSHKALKALRKEVCDEYSLDSCSIFGESGKVIWAQNSGHL